MIITYLTNYSNTTLECIPDVIDNVTINHCTGTISVIPFNQDIIVVLLLIQTCCLVVLLLYNLMSFALARR